MIKVIAVPGFVDNYFWLPTREGRAAVVDPGDAGPIQAALREQGLSLDAILITHHHGDHIGGVPALLESYRVPVFGPRAEQSRIPFIDHPVEDGDRITIPGIGLRCEVIAVPGHTLGHIAYYAPAVAGHNGSLLFCGDTLFVAGCGRLFEGTPAQMHASLSRLAALPGDTSVYCAHEYTLANLAFARAVEPNRQPLQAEIGRAMALRSANLPTVPSTIDRERQFNPFLRLDEPDVRTAASCHSKSPADTPEATFAALRRWKDGWIPPASS